MPYDKEELEKFRLSGKILRETREEMRSFVKENMPIIDVCEKAEGLIRAKGGKPAFPCNVSINEVAAHYTSPPRRYSQGFLRAPQLKWTSASKSTVT